MNQHEVRTIGFAGLAVATFVMSFLGCYPDHSVQPGKCVEDDMDVCTIDKCNANGVVVHDPVPDHWKQECLRGENAGVCIAGSCALNCVKDGTPCNCIKATECQASTQCSLWACETGKCTNTFVSDGTLVDPLAPGDCNKIACQTGIAKMVPDDTDTPTDVAGDCQKPVCTNGTLGTAPDDIDASNDTGCVDNSCASGMAVVKNASIGTQCMGGGCDATGACVDCLSSSDWTICGGSGCTVKKCNGESCQSAADCKSAACADGVCCDTPCTDECKSCNVMGMQGTCSNIPYLETDPIYTDPVFMTPATCNATTASACNGGGKCLKTIGKTCNDGAECMSGICLTPQKVCLGATGEACTSNGACVSGVCNAMGACG